MSQAELAHNTLLGHGAKRGGGLGERLACKEDNENGESSLGDQSGGGGLRGGLSANGNCPGPRELPSGVKGAESQGLDTRKAIAALRVSIS